MLPVKCMARGANPQGHPSKANFVAFCGYFFLISLPSPPYLPLLIPIYPSLLPHGGEQET